jgi:mycothiol synthase
VLLRPADPATDFDAALGVLQACDRAVYGATDWTEAELREQWDEIDLATDSWIAERDGRIAGVMHLCELRGDTFIGDGYVHPDERGRGIGTALVGALLSRVAERIDETPSGRVAVHLAHLVGDETAPMLFAAHGFRRVRSFFRMTRDLTGELPEPIWPPGIELRPFAARRDGPAIHAADAVAFAGQWGYREDAYEDWFRRLFQTPTVDEALPVVAWSDKAVVGFALNYPKRMGDWGWISVLGVVPEWRRQGLGLSLLHESFRRFAATGETIAALGVDTGNPTGALRLYERAGMDVLWQADVWEREVRA